MKSIAKIGLVMLTAVTMAAFTASAQTDSSTSTTPSTPGATAPAKPKTKGKRYNGKIASVDADAKTITFTMASGTSHVIHITSKTKIKKDGVPATLEDAKVGEHISGQEHQDGDNWNATTVNIGETKKKAAAAADSSTPATK